MVTSVGQIKGEFVVWSLVGRPCPTDEIDIDDDLPVPFVLGIARHGIEIKADHIGGVVMA